MQRIYHRDATCPECGDELVIEDISGKGKEYADVCVDCDYRSDGVSREEHFADMADHLPELNPGGYY
jgi:hypothetical protein